MHLPLAALQEDVAQLVRLLAGAHPDPYAAGGGKVAYHRRAEALLEALPDEGLSDAEFLRLLRPFVAAIGDGHTLLSLITAPAQPPVQANLCWEVVEEWLYVAGVADAADQQLLGARLAALDGVAVAELAERFGRLRGCDNAYQLLTQLALALGEPVLLAELLDLAAVPAALSLALLLPDGTSAEAVLRWSTAEPGAVIRPPSAFTPPALNAARMGWSLLAATGEVAWLRVATLRHYREAFEVAQATGFAGIAEERLASVAREATGGRLPDTVEERLAVVPAATELLGELCAAMRAARTSTLLVDLRECDGGNSFFASILGSFLYGDEAILRSDQGYQVKRYSPLYFANYRNASPDEFVSALRNGGYDFAGEQAWLARRERGFAPTTAEWEAWQRHVAQAPTFARECEARAGAGVWTPRVVVLTSAWTYSAGFDTVAMLVRNGATVVGVPSSQAGNCFIDVLRFQLAHSGLSGWVSFKWSQLFPGEPERGRVLRPDRELTYAELVVRRFDPQAAVALALE